MQQHMAAPGVARAVGSAQGYAAAPAEAQPVAAAQRPLLTKQRGHVC